MKKRRQKGQVRHLRLRAALAAVGIVLVLALAYRGGRWLETRNAKPEARGDAMQRLASQTVEVNGEPYRRRDELTTILLMGIDHASDAVVSGYRNGGQADFLRLIAIDPVADTVSQLSIDRDTMTPITILGVLGNRSGVRTAQVSLSHGFGDGGAQSCELTVDAVSNLLLGTPIDFYVAMDLDGISVLNDMVGGVEVTLEDDFSALDPAMTKGTTLTLVGDQAEYYVRNRLNIGVGTNESRMARQEEYLAAISVLIDGNVHADKNFIGRLYDALEPYLTTNMTRGRLINEIWNARDYARTQTASLPGTHQVGTDGFMQFYVDEAALEQTVLAQYYEKLK